MARISGMEPSQTSFLMRMVFGRIRKLIGKDLTPYKIQARVPRVFWIGIITEMLLGQRAGCRGAIARSCSCELRRGSAARFESTSILPAAECMD